MLSPPAQRTFSSRRISFQPTLDEGPQFEGQSSIARRLGFTTACEAVLDEAAAWLAALPVGTASR